MKRILFTLLCGLCLNSLMAQTLPNFAAIPLSTKEDFNEAANLAALQAADYLFSTPMEEDNADRIQSLQYIIRWMSGTPDYQFTVDGQATKFVRKNDDLLGLYMAAMVKYVLENKDSAQDQEKIKLHAVKQLITYAGDEKNKVKLNAELKKAIAANAAGQLEEYLKK